MNTDVLLSALRWVLTLAGTYLLAHGVSDAQWTAISGGILALASLAWGLYVNTRTQKILSVAADPKVDKVKMVDPLVGASIPSPKVV